MKKQIITIAGALGSGKSSSAKLVAQKLGYIHFSSGDLFRSIAIEKGLSLETLNITAEQQRDIDEVIDGRLRHIYETESNIVIDSRMAWHWMPASFKVYLTLDSDTAAERIFMQIQKSARVGESAQSINDVRNNIAVRFASEQKRYAELYNVDVTEIRNYDLIINTKDTDLETTVHTIVDAFTTWQKA